MHYGCLVIIEGALTDRAEIEQALAKVMEGHNDDIWDWYAIGGRWTGELSGYKPDEDPKNVEPCDLCSGTGFRRDTIGEAARLDSPSYTCNACGVYDQKKKKWGHGKHGAGKRVKWPTQWADHHGDVLPLEAALTVLKKRKDFPFYYVIESYRVYRSHVYTGLDFAKTKDFKKRVLKELENLAESGKQDYTAVVVDCHN